MGIFPALVIPLTQVLGLQVADVVALSFLQFFLFGITSLGWGALGDRIGGLPLLKIMFAGCGFSTIACAWTLESPEYIYYSLGAVGLFTGAYHPVGMGLISRTATRVNQSMGYVAAFGGIGMALAPLLTGIICWVVGPGAAFIFAALLSLIGLILTWGLSSEGPSKPEKATESLVSVNPAGLATFLFATVFAGIIATGSALVFPSFLELGAEGFHRQFTNMFSVNLPSNPFFLSIVSVIQLIGVTGQLTGGLIGEKYGPKISYVLCHCVCLVVAFLMSLVSGFSLIILSAFYFFFLLGNQSMENTILAGIVPRRFQHSIFGVKYVLYFGVGSVAVKLMSHIQSEWGVQASFAGLGIISVILVSILAVFLIVDKKSPCKPIFKA